MTFQDRVDKNNEPRRSIYLTQDDLEVLHAAMEIAEWAFKRQEAPDLTNQLVANEIYVKLQTLRKVIPKKVLD